MEARQRSAGRHQLSNTTDQQRTATLRATREPGESDERQVELAPHTTQVLALEQFSREASDNDNRAGGIRVEYKGPEGAVMVTGSLANESEGYSANMPFWPHDQTRSPSKKIDIGSAGIMVGKPDPMVMPGLPTDTKFIPYLTLRNTTPAPLDVALRLNYMPSMAGAIPVNRDLPTQRLRPFEARKVDLEPMLRAAGLRSFNGSINLFISSTGRGGDLILANGSVDQSATYVFEVRPQGIGESIGRISGYWSVANGNDAMFSLWNPTDTPQDIVATVYYGDGSGTYHLPVHLAPQASAMIDVAMLIAEKKPDADGNVIPSSIREGSASFDSGGHDSSAPDGKKRVTTVIAGGLFNTANATCGMLCTYCNGYNNWIILPDLIGPIGWTATASAHATDSYGNDQTLSGGSWSSSNSGIMSVGPYGGVQGISAGQVSIDDFIPNVIVFQGNFCVSDNMPDNCPQANINPSGPGTVTPTVTIDSFEPNPIPGGTTSNAHITVTPSTNINLAITKSGTGTATFGTSGNTTLQIPETTTVNILGGTESNGTADLTLTASYGGSLLDSVPFSVTTGACTLANTGHGGSALLRCPSAVSVYDTYNISEFCDTCQFSCTPIFTAGDTSFTPGNCASVYGGLRGAGNRTLTSTQTGNFAPNDCNVHNLQIKTIVRNWDGTVTTSYVGGTFGLKCDANGSPACN